MESSRVRGGGGNMPNVGEEVNKLEPQLRTLESYTEADRCTKWPTCSLPKGSLDLCTKLAKGMYSSTCLGRPPS